MLLLKSLLFAQWVINIVKVDLMVLVVAICNLLKDVLLELEYYALIRKDFACREDLILVVAMKMGNVKMEM